LFSSGWKTPRTRALTAEEEEEEAEVEWISNKKRANFWMTRRRLTLLTMADKFLPTLA